jgi:hypothetical protein
MKTFILFFFILFYLKADVNFEGGLESWLDFPCHWGHGLASLYHSKIEIPMKWSH